MDDLNFERLNSELAMDAVNEAVYELGKKSPEAAAYFTMGRIVGRADITTMLLKIVESEAKNAKQWQSLAKGSKNDEH